MSVEIERIERIHRFLNGEMSDAEDSGFRDALRTDADLRADLELQKLIYSGSDKIGEGDLRAELEGYYQTYAAGGSPGAGGINPAGPALILPAVLLTLAALVFYFMPSDSEKKQSETEKPVVKKKEAAPLRVYEMETQTVDSKSVIPEEVPKKETFTIQKPTYQSFSANPALARAEASDRGFIFYGFRPAGSPVLYRIPAGKYILQTASGCFEMKPDKSKIRPCDCPETKISLPLAYPSLIRKNDHFAEAVWQHEQADFRWRESPDKGTNPHKFFGKNRFKNMGMMFLPEKNANYLIADGKLYLPEKTAGKPKPASENDKNVLSRQIYEQIYALRTKPEIQAEFERSGRSAESNTKRFSVIFRPTDEQARALLFRRAKSSQNLAVGPGGLSVLSADRADARPPVLVETAQKNYVLSANGKVTSVNGSSVASDEFLAVFLKKHQSPVAGAGFESVETEFIFAPDRTLAKNLPEIRFYQKPDRRIIAEQTGEKACIRIEGPEKPTKTIFFRSDDKLILQIDEKFFDYTNNRLLTDNQPDKLKSMSNLSQKARLFLPKKE